MLKFTQKVHVLREFASSFELFAEKELIPLIIQHTMHTSTEIMHILTPYGVFDMNNEKMINSLVPEKYDRIFKSVIFKLPIQITL